MANFNFYLNFDGNAETAFNTYKSVFGGEFITLQRFGDAPEGEELPQTHKDKIMHVSLDLGNGNILMGSDMPDNTHRMAVGNNFYISVDSGDKEEIKKFFEALSKGGSVEMDLQDTFWGSYFGMLRDRFGIGWMFSYNKPQE